MSDAPDPERFLPLKPLVFEIILVLRERDRHGYGIVQQITDKAPPGPRLFPASLYRTLRQMREQGFIEETDPPGPAGGDDGRRRYFRLTTLGERIARAEARRLEAQVGAARAQRLLPEARSH